jgi:hypothetical protein
MARRLSFERLAMNRTKRRSARIRKLIEEISYDWFDSNIHPLSTIADDLGAALDQFDKDAAELFDDYIAGDPA